MIGMKTDISATIQNIPENVDPNQHPIQIESQEDITCGQCIIRQIDPKGIDQLKGI